MAHAITIKKVNCVFVFKIYNIFDFDFLNFIQKLRTVY